MRPVLLQGVSDLCRAARVFTVECYAANYAEAREVAKAQHPNARILGVNAVFQ